MTAQCPGRQTVAGAQLNGQLRETWHKNCSIVSRNAFFLSGPQFLDKTSRRQMQPSPVTSADLPEVPASRTSEPSVNGGQSFDMALEAAALEHSAPQSAAAIGCSGTPGCASFETPCPLISPILESACAIRNGRRRSLPAPCHAIGRNRRP